MKALATLALALAALFCAACTEAEPQALSLSGEPLFAPELSPERAAALERDLAPARDRLEREPESELAAIWVGRRLAYLGRYREALAAFDAGLAQHPESARLLRHRGHRRITVRDLAGAIADLERAEELTRGIPDEVEPDGAPNEHGIPRSTTQTNITYHLGLAHYLRGSFAESARAFDRTRELSPNDDMLVAACYWLFLSASRAGDEERAREALAPIRAEMDILENDGYHRLLLHFRSELGEAETLGSADAGSLAEATIGYGLAAWAALEGREGEAGDWLGRVLALENWAAFGYIAAEADAMAGRIGRDL